MTIYDRIKQLCKEKGVSVRQMEIDNGMVRGKASKWKVYTPQSDTLLRLSEYFGVTTDYILTGETSEEVRTNDEMALTQTEKKLVLMFRSMDALSQAKLLSYGEGIVSTIQSSEYLTAQKIAEEAMGERKICTPAKHTV